MAYEKQEWENYPIETTPITAERLNHIENGIFDVDRGVTQAKEDIQTVGEDVEDVKGQITDIENNLNIEVEIPTSEWNMGSLDYNTYGNNYTVKDGSGTLYSTSSNVKNYVYEYTTSEQRVYIDSAPSSVRFEFGFTTPTYITPDKEYELVDTDESICEVDTSNYTDSVVLWNKWAKITDDVYVIFKHIRLSSLTSYILSYVTVNITTKTVLLTEYDMMDEVYFTFGGTQLIPIKTVVEEVEVEVESLKNQFVRNQFTYKGQYYASTDSNTTVGNLYLVRMSGGSETTTWSNPSSNKGGRYVINNTATAIPNDIAITQYPLRVKFCDGKWYDTKPIDTSIGYWIENFSGNYKIMWQRMITLENGHSVILMMHEYNGTHYYINAYSVMNGTIYSDVTMASNRYYTDLSAEYDTNKIQPLEWGSNGTYTLKAIKSSVGVAYRWELDE